MTNAYRDSRPRGIFPELKNAALANPRRGALPKAARELAIEHKIQLGRAELTESAHYGTRLKKDWYYYIIKAGRVIDTTRSRRPTAANALALVKRNIRKKNPCTPEKRARATMAKMAPAVINPCQRAKSRQAARNPAEDLSYEADQLQLFAENTHDIYQRKQKLIEVLVKKEKTGRYSATGARNRWRRFYRDAAAQYKRELGNQPRMLVRHMNEAADDWGDYEYSRIKKGEYDYLIKGPFSATKRNKNPKKKKRRGVPKFKVVVRFNRKTGAIDYRKHGAAGGWASSLSDAKIYTSLWSAKYDAGHATVSNNYLVGIAGAGQGKTELGKAFRRMEKRMQWGGVGIKKK